MSATPSKRPDTMAEKLIVIGNGMAGCRAVEELLARAPGRYEIAIFGKEPELNYNRIMLSPVLAGEKSFDDIVINDAGWYERNAIVLHAGVEIVAIDKAARLAIDDRGGRHSYDRLLIATGSNPIMLPLPGADLAGVISFRDIADVRAMLAASTTGARAVVIGGGLLGLEAANGLRARGMAVSVVHLVDTLMERQLDEAASFLLKRELEARGIDVLTGASTECIVGDRGVRGVRLKDGRHIAADLVVMAVGIRANIALAKAAGLDCGRGVVVDDHMRTSDLSIFAVGECVEHGGQTYGLVAPLWEMCKAAADALAGIEARGYRGSAISTKLKVTGIDVFSAGQFGGGNDTEDIVFRDAAMGVYKRLILAGGRLVGAVLYGDTREGNWYFQLVKDATPIDSMRDSLIFGQALFAGSGQNPKSAVSALPDASEICGCNGVCKGTILRAIGEHDLKSVEDVRRKTKASSSCGSCTGLVEQLLVLSLGDDFVPGAATKPMCLCTTLTHDDVRRLILAKEMKSIPEAMQELDWTTPDGCGSCRPALNYYLLCAWPGEYVDDKQSRFINERAHANIQKDGTYSVVPRMWGGVTNPRELRAIADVADKFRIPTVKVTGGQRIDLLGVKKHDLPAVWADLNAAGLVSGHAYGKALRTVKTCVGSEWCRFGTQDSTAMGIRLEKMTWGSWMPHKFKMAVSGCPRNCAEATIKDFGVVATEAGWDLHVGGNGGMRVRATDLLCKVTTDEEAIEYCCAFIQLYREEARYLERTAPWIERVGLNHVKAKLVDAPQTRAALATRFLHSQKFFQVDPWAERAEKRRDRREFAQLMGTA
ncbi:MAG: NAD(P)/FAD-dependent oxidoreductase [Proteobacteria bacterium]|nr:NAD(P)/FAD-dependent oxidoreductase [Pseudomonadota bacterium]